MIKEGNVGYREAIALTTLVLVTKVFYTNPGAVIQKTGTAGWYITLLSAALSLLLFYLVLLLLKRFPGQTLSETFESVFGQVIGKSFSLIFIGYFIFVAGANLREFTEMIKAYILPLTPPSVIIIAFLLPVALITYLGLENLARISFLAFWLVLGGLYSILILATPYYNLDNIFPLGGYGLQTSLFVGITRLSAYNEVIILAFLISSIKGLKKVKLVATYSLLITGVTISLIILCSTLAFEYTMAREHLSNLFELSRIIYYGRFFQRTESVFLIIWVITSVVFVAIVFYMALSIFCRSFKVDDQRPLILPFLFLTFTVALWPENLSQTTGVATNFQRSYSSVIVYLIPLLTLVFSFLLKRKGERLK